jgi:hypothetical protein
MIETLAKMDYGSVFPAYKDLAAQVKEIWAGALAAANQPALQDAECARLRLWLEDLYDQVDSQIPNLKYEKWLRAQDMFLNLRKGADPAVRDDDSISEVLNATWLYRLTVPNANRFELDQIEKNAFEACHMIASKQK